ncbi:MAG: hypothetical protein QOC99_177 [Acidobacteriota bacterium]|jgi:hypothetical protein|nr:hypothetical protein [Acidobacteriota bacterium]
MRDGIKKALALAFLLTCAVVYFGGAVSNDTRGQAQAQAEAQGRAQAENALSKWRPARDYSGLRYVGGETCAGCHTQEAAIQPATPMGRASERAADCEILKTHTRLTFRNGAYTYQITRENGRSVYTVGDGINSISEPILYCFGQGGAGQTYIFQHDGSFYESRVSYFGALQNLDITIDHPRTPPASLEDALGRRMSQEGARGCFGCHTTGGAGGGGSRLETERLSAGVSCEACHGPGERHVAAVRAKDFKNLQIYNPSELDGFDLSQEFCGSCHQSFDTVMSLDGQGGTSNIRFQPYRIFNSRAHLINDRRLSCVACHDPHKQLERDAAFYDSKCLACHLSSAKEVKTRLRSASACPVSTKQCTACHMPKVELPSMHYKFTDHWIRIVKAGEPVPK